MYSIERPTGDFQVPDGYTEKEFYEDGAHVYRAYKKDDTAIFVNHFKSTGEVQVVTDKSCNYFEFDGGALAHVTAPQITQLHLEDFGMAYTVRLCDGRFIVIDGGWGFAPDIDRLFNALTDSSVLKKPTVAMWIMTHPHCDHYHAFFPFYEKYGKDVIIERFMFNFPDADDISHYPKLAEVSGIYDLPETEMIPKFLQLVKRMGVPVYTAHTGQKYKIGGAELEIIASLDDTYGVTENINSTSLVIRMRLGGQVILWGADASVEYAKLVTRYQKLLKADILQVMHHGFGGGSAEVEAKGYELIDPDVCLLPVADYHAYTNFCAFKGGARHLMTAVDIKEMITGDKTVTLTLPYTPDSSAILSHRQKYNDGQQSAGAISWTFAGLDSNNKEDFIFSVLNMTCSQANVTVELYFEDRESNVLFIYYKAPACKLSTVDITDKNSVSSEEKYYNPHSLEKVGIAKDKPFAVRFLSDIPIIVSHKNHKEVYHS